jgi:asparagine N-glycosylation enzyme membrane subunit Stt3
MEEFSRDYTAIIGALFVLTATIWAICIPTIRESKVGRVEFGRLYWLLAVATPGFVIISGLARGLHLQEQADTNVFADIGAIVLVIVFILFAWLLYLALDKLSVK